MTCRRRAHAWLKVFAVLMSCLSISPSPFSCFIRLLCCSCTVTSRPPSRLQSLRRISLDPKARAKRTSARAARSLATWPIPRTPHQVRSTWRNSPLLDLAQWQCQEQQQTGHSFSLVFPVNPAHLPSGRGVNTYHTDSPTCQRTLAHLHSLHLRNNTSSLLH